MGRKKAVAAVKAKKAAPAAVSSRRDDSLDGSAKKRHDKAKKGKPYSGGIAWEQLKVLGLKIREVTADGNCFFRAVADQLEGSQASHAELRSKTVAYIQSHEEEFKPFVEDEVSFAEYCRGMGKDGTWAGHLELQALSLLTRANICIHRLEEPRWHIRNFQDPRTRTLHISYHDREHYNSVRREDDDTSEPARPIIIESDAQPGSKPPPPKDSLEPSEKDGAREGGAEAAVRQVAAGTGCSDEDRVRQVLADTGGDVEAAIEYLIAADSPAEGDEGVEHQGVNGSDKGSFGGESAEGTGLDRDRGGSANEAMASDSVPDWTNLSGSLGGAEDGADSKHSAKKNPLPPPQLRRPGRNQPCTCGSKKKYKTCCGAAQRPHPANQRDEERLTNKERQGRLRQDQQSRTSEDTRSSRQTDEDISGTMDLGSLCI